MPKTLKRFRVLLTLADGRQVYSAREGVIEIIPASKAEEIKWKTMTWFGYTPDLKKFGLVAELKKQGLETVAITGIAFEAANSPLTKGAFVQGGALADANQQKPAST